MKETDKKLSIAMVGYLNTIPMVHGMRQHRERYDVSLEVPSRCYELYRDKKVDVALLPVGTLASLEDSKIITDYCIGCIEEVRTVCLFSNSPIEKIEKVYLDSHSRTSVLLTRVLMKHHWKQEVEYIDTDIKNLDLTQLEEDEMVLMIGDKVFDIEGQFAYCYDLGKVWYEYSGLPFVFAVWVAREHVSPFQVEQLNEDLAWGIDHKYEAIKASDESAQKMDLETYFTEHIDYHFDDAKREALEMFLGMGVRTKI